MEPGTSLERLPGGPYRQATLVGRGGLGAVYRAERASDGGVVALKVLSLVDEDTRIRLAREVRALLAIPPHPNLVRLLAAHVEERSPQATLIIEWVDGANLDVIVQRASGGLPEDVVAALTQQLCLAVGHLHGHGFVHRDLKPSNMLIATSGTLKVSDFGLLKAVGKKDDVTAVTNFVGTLRYASPESFRGEDFDERDDLYALGMTLAFMLTGTVPIRAASVPELVSKILNGDIDLSTIDSPRWRSLVTSLVAFRKEDRLPTAATVLDRLKTIGPQMDDAPAVVRSYLEQSGTVLVPDTPRPPRTPYDAGAVPDDATMVTLLRGLAGQIARAESPIADVTLQSARESLRPLPPTAPDDDSTESIPRTVAEPQSHDYRVDGAQRRGTRVPSLDSLSPNDTGSEIDTTFRTIQHRLRYAWLLGLIMTFTLFGLFAGMIVASVVAGLKTGASAWTLVFGSTSVASLLGLVVWRPFDRMFFATILVQQLEMLQLNYARSIGGSENERRRVFRETLAQLDSLMAKVLAQREK